MARKKRKTTTGNRGQRDAYRIANQSLYRLLEPVKLGPLVTETPIRLDHVQDNRVFDPENRERTVDGNRLPPHKPAKTRRNTVPAGIAYSNPKRVPTCVRRSKRQEVLFALNRTGKGAKSKRRFNERSKISCKG